MAMSINDSCIACGVCLPECPNKAICVDANGQYFIRRGLCTECYAVHASPRCLSLCPIPQCIEPSQGHSETKDELLRKVHRIALQHAFKAFDAAQGK